LSSATRTRGGAPANFAASVSFIADEPGAGFGREYGIRN